MTVPLGFIGLGSMGMPMTQHLLKAGHTVIVYDLDDAAVNEAKADGAETATSPADVAGRAEIVFACVNTPQALIDIVLGENGACQGEKLRVFVDLSTTGPPTEIEVAAGLEGTGITLVDSPISGGRRGAIAGTLAVMMAGPDAACEEVKPLIETFGKNIFRIGDTPGQAQTMKVANTLMASTASAVTAEVLVMGVKAGLDPNLMIDVFNTSTARNSATLEKFPDAVLPRTFNLGSMHAIVLKDLNLYLEAARTVDAPTILGPAVVDMWEESMAANGKTADNSTIVKFLESKAGVIVGSE
ncbi:MAG: oxidoreductase [Thiotrichales bacterium]|nr:oxidoreductase [Thiotrichales bacterium]